MLVAFSQNDLNAAYVIGGLWSTRDRPPLSLPTDFIIKRVIKTGIAGREAGVGQVGAGVVRAPLSCFTAALEALAA